MLHSVLQVMRACMERAMDADASVRAAAVRAACDLASADLPSLRTALGTSYHTTSTAGIGSGGIGGGVVVEPWLEGLCLRLRDKKVTVRREAMVVLTSLWRVACMACDPTQGMPAHLPTSCGVVKLCKNSTRCARGVQLVGAVAGSSVHAVS